MIRLHRITINEFRGIRDFVVDLDGENFALCGPNGTGKSGIVDAIEFALTGNVSRLSGQGTGGLTIKEHGPHVDSRDKPEQAQVKLEFSLISNGKKATIHRTVKNSRNPNVSPEDPDISEALLYTAQHPEFALSRRELIRYIISEPGKRSQEVQALLKLEKLETVRAILQKICNGFDREAKPLENNRKQTREDLIKALGITQLTNADLLREVNKRRLILSLPEISKLEPDTSLKDGMATMTGGPAAIKIPKTQALEDMKDLDLDISAVSSLDFGKSIGSILDQVSQLNQDPKAVEGLSRKNLLDLAGELFDEKSCPVCDTEWDPQKFREVLNKKLAYLADVKKQKDKIEKDIQAVVVVLTNLERRLSTISKYGPLFPKPIDTQSLVQYQLCISNLKRQLIDFTPLSKTIEMLKESISVPAVVTETVENLKKGISEIPEPSQQESAREYLIVAQEKLENYRKASQDLEVCKAKAASAKRVFDCYVQTTNQELEGIYKKVETTFRDLYRIINSDDESAFEAKLTPSMGKLGFDVDFYGRGYFPPGAYHSEGHQDGMGLCLYLALMSHLQEDHFTFSVLDDVLMSVDAGHRREVCSLLRQRFPKTQFILTTHDDIWLRHMRTSGLLKERKYIHFRTWNVESGPMEWDRLDVWEKINKHLEKNEVKQASALLREYLEYLSKELCHRLGAPVVFRGDAHFNLGDLLPPAIKKFRELLKDGKRSAESWDKAEDIKHISSLIDKFEQLASSSQAEQWQINSAVHYNEWANLQKNDFSPVVDAFKNLTSGFKCVNCSEVLFVTPERGEKESLRCSCSATNINLIKK